jgi:hypothetical protein
MWKKNPISGTSHQYFGSTQHPHCNKNPFMYSFYGNCAGLSYNFHIHVSVWAIYIFPGSVHIFFSSRIGRSFVGKYKSLTYTWMWKLGQWQRNSFSVNTCFEFSVLDFLCSVPFTDLLLLVGPLSSQCTIYIRSSCFN